MPRAGGQATVTGIDFDIWYVAFKFTDAFFDNSIKIKPEALSYSDPSTGKLETASIDDIYIFYGSKQEFYNIKYRAPNARSWTFSTLKQEKVLKQFKEQFNKTPDADLYFVTQSPCLIFAEVLPRGASCTSREELDIKLKPNRYIDEWDKLKEEMGFSDDEMLKFAKQVRYKSIDIDEIKDLIKKRFRGHVTNFKSVPNCLYQLAVDAAKKGKTITRDDIINYFKENNIYLKPHLRVEELLEKIHSASATLATVPYTFGNAEHIEREEVATLVNWIKIPLKEKDSPIAVITGKAGSGKTVVMRDLLVKLQKEKIPVLGIKTDLLPFNTINKLNQELSLPDGILPTMAAIVEKYGIGVVLFDQIDALSLSMSEDRDSINMYFNLIFQLTYIKNLRIIISCRDFDLRYDPVLKSFKDKKRVEIKEFSDQQVESVLSELNIRKESIPDTLFGLLKTPLYLKIFSEIYTPQLNLKTLNSLQNFYDEYWEQEINLISDQDIQKDVFETINIVIKKMDESKMLTVPFALLDNYNRGKEYLLSKSILIRQGNKLQFFHSSFFDYCYARRFASEKSSLIEVILHQHQGLFVRSQIKQVLSYLRGSDFQKYLVELKQFLTNSDVRFHIRLLVINLLGFQQDPTDEEWHIAKQLLEEDNSFKKHFINSIQSKKWLKYLISNGYLQDFLQSGDKELINIIVWKLSSLLNTCTEIVLDFLKDFPNIDDKDEYICSILYRLEHWDNEKAIKLFQEKLPFIKKWSSQYYNYFLESIVNYNPEIVFEVFFNDLNEKVNHIKSFEDLHSKEFLSHNSIEIFEKLLKWNPNIVLPNALQIISKLIDKTRPDIKDKFYYDMAFHNYEHFETDIYSHWQFLSLALQKLETVAVKDKTNFIKLIEDFSTSNSLTLLNIIMKCYNAKPELYVNEGFKLLTRDSLLENMASTESLKALLKNLYPHFSKEQKEKINGLILSVSPDWEKRRRKGQPSMIGLSKYKLLCAIPSEQLSDYPTMKKQFLELKHKFGKCEKYPLRISGVARFVGPPLQKTAYEKMTSNQWLFSFKKYDESTKWGTIKENSIKGGIEEHSRAFAEQVSKHPDKFYELVFNIGKRNDISITYFRAGLDGLIKAKYDIEKIKGLVNTYWKLEDKEVRKTIINAIKYINDQDNLDLDLITILKEYALKDRDPEKELWKEDTSNGNLYYSGDAFTYGINTVRGWASAVLGIHSYKTHYPDLLFKIFNEIAKDKSIAVRSCLIHFLPGMIKWDINKTFKLFMKLTEDMNPQVIENGLQCIAYLMTKENFEIFIPHLMKVITTPDLQNHRDRRIDEYIGELLTLAYAKDLPGSKQLLEQSLKANVRLKLGMISFSSRNLNDPDEEISKKSQNMYMQFIDDDSDEVSEVYDRSFRNFNTKDLRKLYPLFVKYSNSHVIRKENYFFFEFLERAVTSEPEKCIDLVEGLKDFRVPQGRYSDFPRQATQVLIEAYNRVSREEYKEKAMDIFDSILQEEFYRSEGLKILNKQDRE